MKKVRSRRQTRKATLKPELSRTCKHGSRRFATPLTLLLLPSLYMIQHDLGKLIRKIPGLEKYYFIPASEKN